MKNAKEKRSSVAQSSSPVSGVADRYAQSLFELALDENSLETVESELDSFEGLIRDNADFRRLVESPAFSSDEQLRAIAAIVVEVGASPLTSNFLKVVAANRRLFVLPSMIRRFRELTAEHRGEVEVEVTSAHPLDEGQRSALSEAVSSYAGKTVTMRETVDSAILGGLIVKIGSRQIDTSLRSKLNSLKLALKEVG
ncbi:F0F1 ATP synthase subunit delta [Aurantimonas sp. 22II-16-19i]|nr:F0F1 ATP synthase subunit delta [Aurantimonas sp. 22II-16-19i]